MTHALPKYRCHKEVRAAKIALVIEERAVFNRNLLIVFAEDGGLTQVAVSQEFLAKHKPQIGGYYVHYEDGYESFSPAEAFESGYTRIDG